MNTQTQSKPQQTFYKVVSHPHPQRDGAAFLSSYTAGQGNPRKLKPVLIQQYISLGVILEYRIGHPTKPNSYLGPIFAFANLEDAIAYYDTVFHRLETSILEGHGQVSSYVSLNRQRFIVPLDLFMPEPLQLFSQMARHWKRELSCEASSPYPSRAFWQYPEGTLTLSEFTPTRIAYPLENSEPFIEPKGF